MIIQKSKNGLQIFGRDGGKIGPAAVFFDVEPKPNLAGTVSAGTSPSNKSSTLDGASTTFTSSLQVGDYIEILTTPTPYLAYVWSISDNTTLVMHDPNNIDEPLELYVPANTNYRKFSALWVGKTLPDGIKITLDESTVSTKSSDRGEMPENVFSAGTTGKIELSLMEASLEILNKILDGMVHITRDTNGRVVASSIGSRVGYDYKKNAKRIAVIEYNGIKISDDPQDRLDIFKVCFSGAFNIVRNSSDAQGITLTGHIFEDDTRRINGVPQFLATNLPAMVFD